MSQIVPSIRAIVREELAKQRGLALAQVTQVFTNEGGSGDEHLTVNARLRGSVLELQKVPVTVGRSGISAMPRVDDLVLVGFLEGDLNAPVVMGVLYDTDVPPPDAAPDELVYVVPDEESDDARRLHMELPNGNALTVTDGQVEIVMGGTKITVEADGAIQLQAPGNIELSADGDIALSAGGKFTAEAQQDATVKGLNATMEGQAGAKVKGPTVTLAGNTSFSPT